MSAARAVVFGYHDVGVRCLEALLSGGVDVPLVVTVADDPHEAQWFGSVAATAAEYGIEAIAPADGHGRLGTLGRERPQPSPFAARQHDREHVWRGSADGETTVGHHGRSHRLARPADKPRLCTMHPHAIP